MGFVNLKLDKLFICIIFFVTNFYSSFAYAADSYDEVNKYVNDIINNATKVLNDKTLTEEEILLKSRDLLSKNLDLDWMAHYTLGRNKRSLRQSQIADFATIYNQYVIKTFLGLIKNYKGEKTVVKHVDRIDEGEFVVKTEVIKTNGQQPIKVDYLVRDADSGVEYDYKVSDIITEGVSMISSQQSEFASIIINNSFEDLIKNLEAKLGK